MTLPYRHALALALTFGFSFPLVTAAVIAPARAADAHTNASAATITGSVTTADGVPIRHANVVVVGEGRSQTGHTDASGRFVIPNLGAGTYAIRVSALGYDPLGPRPIGVAKAATTDLALTLVHATTSLATIGRVQSNGGEALSTSSAPVSTINAQTYAAEGYTRVSDVLQDDMSTTLVHPANGGSTVLPTSVALRGPDPTETLVDIDGHQVNSGNTGDFDLSLLDPADYSSIELVKGISPSSLVGPDTIDGAINIRTLEPTQTPHGLLRLSAGSFNSFGQTLQETGTVGRLGYAFSLHNTTTDGDTNGPIIDANTGLPASVGTSVDGKTALGKLRYAFGNNGGAYAEFSFHDQSVTRDLSAALSSYPDPPLSGPPGTPVVDGFEGSSLAAHNAGYGLDVRVPLGAGDTIGTEPASLLFRHYTSLVSQSVFGDAEATSPYLYNDRDVIGDDSLEFDKAFAHGSLTLQYSIRNEDLTVFSYDTGDINLESVARRAAGVLDVARADDTSTAAPGAAPANALLTQTQRAAVLRYIYDPTAKLHLTAAAYYSDYSSFGHNVDPRFGLVYTPDARTALRFSVGTTYQAPQLPELYVAPTLPAPVDGIITTGNPSLHPDHATEYGLGASHIFLTGADETEASIDLYRVNLRAPSVTYTQSGIVDPSCGSAASGGDGTPCLLSYAVNAGNGIYQGIELSASRRLGPYVTLRAGYAVRSAYVTNIPPFLAGGSLVVNQQDYGLPLQKATLQLIAAPPRGLTFRATLVDEGQYNELNQPPYATLAAAVGYRWPAVELIFSGTNLFNVYAQHFTSATGGVPQTVFGGTMAVPAYVLQGTAFSLSIARRF